MDIFHINLASQAEKSYSTRARWALRAIRKYVLLGLKPSGHIVYRPRTGCTIPPARLRWYEYISATLPYLEHNWLYRMNYCVWLQFRFHSVLLFDSSYNGFSVWTWTQCMFESLQPSHWNVSVSFGTIVLRFKCLYSHIASCPHNLGWQNHEKMIKIGRKLSSEGIK